MPIVSIPLYWPLTWPRQPDAPAGKYEDWLLWRYARREELAQLFTNTCEQRELHNIGANEN